jgi:hypothetical protein
MDENGMLSLIMGGVGDKFDQVEFNREVSLWSIGPQQRKPPKNE